MAPTALTPLLRRVRRLAVALAGGTVLCIGVAMVVLPGPAIVVIPAGLAILATEFFWARRLLTRLREQLTRGGRGRPGGGDPDPTPP